MKYFRVATANTPEVSFDLRSGFISISGVSTTINSVDFYRNFIDELVSFREEKKEIIFNLSLKNFNTGTAKYIYDILLELKRRIGEGNRVLINWFYDKKQNEMLEMGIDYSNLVEMDFTFHEIGRIDI
ncbi:MAG: SiaC family regulatory phosphoprotein [Ekhidna sp.]